MTTNEEPQAKSEVEIALEKELQDNGWIITLENPEHPSGSTTYYRIELAKIDLPDVTTAGQGVDRMNALRGALVASRAK